LFLHYVQDRLRTGLKDKFLRKFETYLFPDYISLADVLS
jgi:hypothetical protein